ncbi:MAG: Rpn family recombination-promoting nuclease/putative transposase [Treponema sp.]|nr:Rpn family recombination-promoting nuclease/putative transposase [Treponema sp.]
MKSKEFRVLNPRLDVNFKAIFTQNTRDSRDALKSFLTAAIGREIKKVSVIENENPKQFDLQRGISYDINCVFEDETCAQIEMQGFEKAYDYGKRAEYYVSRLVSSAVETGDDWNVVPEAYQISVLNFCYDKSNDKAFHHYIMADEKDGAKLAGILNVIFMELPKIPEINNLSELKNLPSLVKWCKFLQEADNPDKEDLINALSKSEEGIMKAESTLKGISMDRWRWIIQGQIEGIERDRITELNARKREDEKRRIEDEKRRIEDEKRRIEDEKRAKEDEKRRIEDEKRAKEDEKRRIEDEKRRIEDERRAREDEKRRIEDEKRRIEDEKRAQKDKELSQREAALADGEEKLSETRNKLLASASKLLALGLSPEQISDALSLPIDDVHNLRLSAET